jgi:hypothetical protein
MFIELHTHNSMDIHSIRMAPPYPKTIYPTNHQGLKSKNTNKPNPKPGGGRICKEGRRMGW